MSAYLASCLLDWFVYVAIGAAHSVWVASFGNRYGSQWFIALDSHVFPVHKGVVWLLLATAAEVTPVVGPLGFLCVLSSLIIKYRRCSLV